VLPSGGEAITEVGISDSTGLGRSDFFENKPIATAPSIHFLARAEPCRACFSTPHLRIEFQFYNRVIIQGLVFRRYYDDSVKTEVVAEFEPGHFAAYYEVEK